MQYRRYVALTAAALAATPPSARAVTFTFSYDPNDIIVNGTVTPFTGSSSSPTLSIPFFSTISIGVDVTVTNNPNSTFAYHGVYDETPGSQFQLQPQNLGIAAFGMGFNTSNHFISMFDPSNANINSDFTSAFSGPVQADGSISAGFFGGGLVSPSLNSSTTAGVAKIGFGANPGPAELFNNLVIETGPGGNAVITASTTNSVLSYIAYNGGGTSSTSKPAYKNVVMSATDTVNPLPALNLIVRESGHYSPIIDLEPGTTEYGPPDGTLTLKGAGNGNYAVATAQAFSTATTGSVSVSGFYPSSDHEVFAVKLAQNGVDISTTNTTLLSAIANAISSGIEGNDGFIYRSDVTASLVTGAYASLFPGYDLLLTPNAPFVAGPGGTAELGFDFSTLGLENPAYNGVTVTGVAAVPEPTAIVGVFVGAAALFLGRRRSLSWKFHPVTSLTT